VNESLNVWMNGWIDGWICGWIGWMNGINKMNLQINLMRISDNLEYSLPIFVVNQYSSI